VDDPRLHQQLGRPAMSLCTLHRRVREVACWRRPRLVAKGDPDRDQVLAGLRQTIGGLSRAAGLLAEDETHINLLPWVRTTRIADGCRQQVMTPGTNRRRTIFGAVNLRTGRFVYQVARKAVSATFIAFLEQLQQVYPAAPVVAVICDNVIIHHSKLVQRWLAAHPRVVVLHGARYSPHDPGRADLGRAEGMAGELTDADDPSARPPGPRVLPGSQPHADPGDRRATQLTLAA
jgi:DDE superfamily endonuclease